MANPIPSLIHTDDDDQSEPVRRGALRDEPRAERAFRQAPDIHGVSREVQALARRALARELVERAREQLDPVLPESQLELTFRASSGYVLERHD